MSIEDQIWTDSTRRFIKYAMLIHHVARLPITMDHLLAVANSLSVLHPASGQLTWPEGSHLHACFERAKARGADPGTLQECHAYFCVEMLRPGSSRFVASILGSFTNMADKFMSRKIKTLFFGRTTFLPSFSRKGAVIVLDLGRYGAIGRIGMLLFKNIWCKELLRRQGLPPGERPCFLYCDEYQTLTTPIDGRLFEKRRSSLVAACCLVQNFPSLYKAFEAGRAHDQVDNMLGNFANMVFTQQHCRITNHIAAEILAKSKVLRRTGGVSTNESEQRGWNMGSSSNSSAGPGGGSSGGGSSSGSSGGWSTSQGINEGWREEYDYLVHEEVFSRLHVGPPRNTVESILFSSGMRFETTGRPWTPVSWPQH